MAAIIWLLSLQSLPEAFPARPAPEVERLLLIDTIIPPRPGPLPNRVLSEPDHWLALDKFWHLSASLVTVGAGYHLCANRLDWQSPAPTCAALAGTFTLGLGKELLDRAGPRKHFSYRDLIADAAGIGLGYLIFIHKY